MKVLIVDEHVAGRENLARIVTAAGHEAIWAETGDEAFSRALLEQPGVILIDANMPELDAFAATRRLKADVQTCDIPVVFITGENRKADIAFGLMLGASGFVTKPYSDAELLAHLDT